MEAIFNLKYSSVFFGPPNIYIYIYIYVCMCVCVCGEREIDRQTDKHKVEESKLHKLQQKIIFYRILN